MSVKGIHWAQQMRGVCPYKKAVLFALGERHNVDTNLCFGDHVMIAQEAGMSERTLRKYLALLKTDRLIETRLKIIGGRRVTHYVLKLNLRQPQPAAPDEVKRQTAPIAKRQTVPVGRNGKCAPVRNGNCVPFHIDTNLHESSVSNETAPELFSETEMGPAKPEPPIRRKQAAEGRAELATANELQKAQIFTVGKLLLGKQGMPEQAAGKFLGGLIKRSSVAIVARIINAVANDPPLDAKSYLTGAVQRQAKAAGIAPPQDAETKSDAEAARLEALDRRMAHAAKGGIWAYSWGRDPRQDATGVPPSLYQKHGIPHPEAGLRRA